MYTECPNCQTVFRVSAQQLRAAAGKVRCGRCSQVFDALAHRTAWEPEGAETGELPLSPPEPETAPAAPAQIEPSKAAPPEAARPVRPERPSSSAGIEQPTRESSRPGAASPQTAAPLSAAKQASPRSAAPGPENKPDTPTAAQIRSAMAENAGNSPPGNGEPDAGTDGPALSKFATQRNSKGAEPEKGDDTSLDWDPFSEESIEALLRPVDGEPEPPSPAVRKHKPSAQKAVRFQSKEPRTPPKKANRPRSEAETKSGPAQKNERAIPPRPAPPAKPSAAEEDSAELPLQLQTRPKRGRGVAAALFWSLGVLLVLAVLGGQYAYFNRDRLALQGQWRPYLEQLCEFAGCNLPPRRDLAVVELTDHAVQSHPRRDGALLITATLLNGAGFPQPYPEVEVIMMDVEQRPVAARRFTPAEYLAGRSPDDLFAAGQEAHLMLEVVDPGPRAVSFEFDFH